MDFQTWYQQLSKPTWTPAPGTIGLIWQILYPIIVISFSIVFYRAFRKTLPRKVAWPFAINLVANLLFMPLFGGLKNLPLATLDILVVLGTIAWMMFSIWSHQRWIALAQVPYLIWVTTATYLQVWITLKNWR